MSINLKWRPPPGLAPFSAEIGFTKHYGPGPHPGTGTSQSVHGSETATLDRDISPTEALVAAEGFVTIDQSLRDEIPDFDISARTAVGRFRLLYPDSGLAPVHFSKMVFNSEPNSMFAYVSNQSPNTIKVDSETWDYLVDEQLAKFQSGPPRLTVWAEAGRIHNWRDDMVLEALLFHEVAHSAAQMTSPLENGDFPAFNKKWYGEKIDFVTDPNLPSKYAALNPPEFFAEALTDVAYLGDEARGHSKLTDIRYRHYLQSLKDM